MTNLPFIDFGTVVTIEPVGSRVTCNPPPLDTDEDYLVLTFDQTKTATILQLNGFRTDGSPEFYTGNDNGGFRSYRKESLNVITTSDPKFFDLFMTATELAKRYNLMKKEDRITLFQTILYGVTLYECKGRITL